MPATLHVEAVAKGFRHPDGSQTSVIEDIDFFSERSEVIALLGRSGSGKSTLLNIIAGLLPPDRGSVRIGGAPASKTMSEISFMQQSPQLLPFRTVFENACLGIELRREVSPAQIRLVGELLTDFGLAAFRDHYPSQLSGGMQQKVAFARTMAVSGSIVLCDEPFSAIDMETRLELEALFRRQVINHGKLAIFVTHDIDAAVSVADRILVLGGRPGQIAATVEIPRDRGDPGTVLPRGSDVFSCHAAQLWQAIRRNA